MMTAAQINASQKATVDQWFGLADRALDETGKLLALNFSVCRESMEDMARSCQSACDVHDLASAWHWQTSAFKPFAERSAEYGARWMGLASGSSLDFGRSFEAQWEHLGRQVNDWMARGPAPMALGQTAPGDYLRHTMQAFDSVWEAMRENLAQSQRGVEAPQQMGHRRPAKVLAGKGQR